MGQLNFSFGKTDLPPEEIKRSIKEARTEARKVVKYLDPDHIRGWTDLIQKLESALVDLKSKKKVKMHIKKRGGRRT